MRYVSISSSDDRMDCRSSIWDPINPLPPKCSKCGFPDLDHVPQPYFLVKSRTVTSNELAEAENGNLFVRDRVRRVLDLLIPGQCTYFPTCYKGTTQQTPWQVVIPNYQVSTAKVKPSIRRCELCDEPRSAHPGTQWCDYHIGTPIRVASGGEDRRIESAPDVLKSSTWGSSESGWDKWISRDLLLSVRLFHLLKKIKAKGFHEATCGKPTSADKDEAAWIQEKLDVLAADGIPLHPADALSDADAKWLRDYIRLHATNVEPKWDIRPIEKRIKAKLPKSYIDFVTSLGSVEFHNVDEEEGFTASILCPDKLEFEGSGDGYSDAESNAVNALTFALTEHGDSFCFDVQKGRKEYAIFLYKHEGNFLEPYAENFAASIRRFAGG